VLPEREGKGGKPGSVGVGFGEGKAPWSAGRVECNSLGAEAVQ